MESRRVSLVIPVSFGLFSVTTPWYRIQHVGFGKKHPIAIGDMAVNLRYPMGTELIPCVRTHFYEITDSMSFSSITPQKLTVSVFLEPCVRGALGSKSP